MGSEGGGGADMQTKPADRPRMPPCFDPPVAESPPGPPRFRLIRYFSIASLVGLLMVMGALMWSYSDLAQRQLVEHEGRANANLARAFANAMWPRHRAFVLGSAGRSAADLQADPAVAALRQDVLGTMRGSHVAKIKIYNTDGLTVFSTQPSQIGEDKGGLGRFLAARGGQVTSQIDDHDRAVFVAMESVLTDRSLISSYVPAYAPNGSDIEGVFEVYSDVTDLLRMQRRAAWQVSASVLLLLGVLYVFLYSVVRKADRIMADDARQRARQEEQVRHLAFHDPLTGLPNRAQFADRLVDTVALAARHDHCCALMFIDLDRFKDINDRYGHAAGDAVLGATARRLAGELREGDVLFRMGGDEFTLILPQIESPQTAARVAERMVAAVAPPIVVAGQALTVGATIGIAVYPGDGDGADALLRNADDAMYAAKATRKGSYAFYSHVCEQRDRVEEAWATP